MGSYRDKKVVGVFVRFSCTLHQSEGPDVGTSAFQAVHALLMASPLLSRRYQIQWWAERITKCVVGAFVICGKYDDAAQACVLALSVFILQTSGSVTQAANINVVHGPSLKGGEYLLGSAGEVTVHSGSE
jgi:hypothetical protein